MAVTGQSTVPPSTEAIGSPDGWRSTALVGEKDGSRRAPPSSASWECSRPSCDTEGSAAPHTVRPAPSPAGPRQSRPAG
jgi:hypothetical protein